MTPARHELALSGPTPPSAGGQGAAMFDDECTRDMTMNNHDGLAKQIFRCKQQVRRSVFLAESQQRHKTYKSLARTKTGSETALCCSRWGCRNSLLDWTATGPGLGGGQPVRQETIPGANRQKNVPHVQCCTPGIAHEVGDIWDCV